MQDGFGAHLKQLREGRGLTLRAVEGRCEVSNGYLSLLEHDRIDNPSPHVLYRLAGCYGVDYLGLMARAGYPLPGDLPVGSRPEVVLYGVDRLTEDEQREVQNFINFKLAQAKKRQKEGSE